MLNPLHIGHNATLRVRDVNRGTVNLINFLFLFLVVIMAECEGIYSVGCREGKLSSKFTAANLQVISKDLLSSDEASDLEI
ncbi:hypothetical protein T05_5909 [Trichinella murrelli]|uniref:Uncharacterized protein n=1 Tax=Trichinella murrelli TaxID=144512 RepID=A0A0V0TN47_9BILA|nr:hypothetical protein T05_5909 [Trichinella murrelli]